MADGKMVHEKTQGDRMFFYFTVALTALGVAGSFHYFYKAAFPQKRNWNSWADIWESTLVCT